MKWTKETLQNEADKYLTRNEFSKNNSKAYNAASDKKIMNELFKNHKNQGYSNKQVRKGYWSNEKLQKEANKYVTRNEFCIKNPSAYSATIKKKIINELFKNHKNHGHTNKQVPFGYWTTERLQAEADKYLTRTEFSKNNSGAYSAASDKKIMDELFKKHQNNGYSDKEEWKENSYVVYAYELKDFNKVYVGLTNNMIRRDREHLFSEKEKLSLFCKKNNLPLPKYKILEDNLNNKNVRNFEEYWYKFYKDNGWDMFNVAKTGSLGAAATKWTKKSLQKEADKCITRSEFSIKNGSAYTAASNKKLMDELFKNHPNQGLIITSDWTKEALQEEANKYKTRRTFQIKNPSAYLASSRKKIIDELFQNHPNKGYFGKPNGYWTKETLQEEANEYLTRSEFSIKNKGAYHTASNKKIIDELFQNHPNNGYIKKTKTKNN